MITYTKSKDVPVPSHRRGRQPLYDFPKLKRGESFFVQTESERNAYRKIAKRDMIKIVTRTERDGYRIWRAK